MGGEEGPDTIIQAEAVFCSACTVLCLGLGIGHEWIPWLLGWMLGQCMLGQNAPRLSMMSSTAAMFGWAHAALCMLPVL
jgi:hypothetical protein